MYYQKLSAVCIPDHMRVWHCVQWDYDGNEFRTRVNDTRYRYAAVMFGNPLTDDGYGYDFISIQGYATDDRDDLDGLRSAWSGDIDAGIIEIWDFDRKRFLGIDD